jgi:hypothetical protein
MNVVRPLRVAVLAAIALASVPAAAQLPGPNMSYLMAKGGATFPTAKPDLPTTTGTVRADLNNRPVWEGAVGYWSGFFGGQLSAGYQKFTSGPADVRGIPVTAMLQLRLPLEFVVPYVEGGLGAYFAQFQPAVSLADVKRDAVTLQSVVGGGLDFVFGPLILGAEYRYQWVKPKFKIAGTEDVPFDLSSSIVTLDVGIGF